mmetsp:Transcript_150374/g.280425  ORF Transcript_150374/g.280425 Transcript_150374/m.280425 type:complete len:231 (+) Transcript_150374:594-1286(+)
MNLLRLIYHHRCHHTLPPQMIDMMCLVQNPKCLQQLCYESPERCTGLGNRCFRFRLRHHCRGHAQRRPQLQLHFLLPLLWLWQGEPCLSATWEFADQHLGANAPVLVQWLQSVHLRMWWQHQKLQLDLFGQCDAQSYPHHVVHHIAPPKLRPGRRVPEQQHLWPQACSSFHHEKMQLHDRDLPAACHHAQLAHHHRRLEALFRHAQPRPWCSRTPVLFYQKLHAGSDEPR